MKAFGKLLFTVCVGCLMSATASAVQPITRPAALPRDSIYQLPAKLVDQRGNVFEWSALRGRSRVVSMFYTSCQLVCPLIIDAGKAIEKSLAPKQRERLGFVVVSMDPKRDTVAALARVSVQRGLDPARWTLASPQPGDVRAIAGLLGVRYRQLSDGGFNHSTVLVLLDADGRVLARTEKVGTVVDQVFLAATRRAAAAPPTVIASRQ